MYISKINLENFKSFENIEVDCNENFNVVVGENNIGKSTIFEALILWKYAYDTLIQARNSKRFYKASSNYYIPFSELSQIRLVNDDDIFYDSSLGSTSITLTVTDATENFSLKIKFEKPGIKNSYLRIFNNDGFEEFERFSTHIESKECTLKNAIFIYQTRPISTIFKNEPFYNNAQIEKKISIGKSHDVLRNKILKTENTQARKVAERFEKLEGRINRVLKSDYQIRFKNNNRIDDEYVRITTQCSSHKELEISMMGSGFLQVVEIFSTIEYIERSKGGICLILIDEPDSHIHSDLQSHLIDELKSHDESQVYVISHNDRLINKVEEGELFYLNKTVKGQGSLSALSIDNFSSVKEGLASVLSEIEKSENKPIILTEGKTDQKILQIAWNKLYSDTELPYSIVSSGIHFDEESRTGSADTVRRSLEYLANIVDRKVAGIFDNDREGNERFKLLSKDIFENYSLQNQVRKHLTKDIYGITLPVPEFRSNFINEGKLTQRYFVIEHYFTDEILEAYNLKDDPILLGTDVFLVKGSKNDFAENCNSLDPSEFENFRPLFEQLDELLLSESA
ncbi:ATP-dependent nuclease [Synechococcus sp. MIT S9507]|uniref:ATP-dependent nuclease n=1 Tax=Synechococcus sp. MIT S9507 TaxID=3082544 RepID=UPI0039B61C05